jgi:hypothetical protein
MKTAVEYITNHPYYIPFILLNVYIIYRVILKVINDDLGDDGEDDDDDDPHLPEGPELDLPPGVSLPVEPELVED